MTRKTKNRSRNNPARNLAIANDAPAIGREPEKCGDEADRQEYKSHVEHGATLRSSVLRNPCPSTETAELGQNPPMNTWLTAAIEEADRGRAEGGIPIGAVLVHRGAIIGRGHNRRVQQGSAVLHGEMDAIESAGRHTGSVYRESTMYTTLSPCAMCSGAILLYGIPYVVVGENRTFLGEEDLLRARGVRVEVVQDERCIRMMEAFIAAHPELWNEDIGK